MCKEELTRYINLKLAALGQPICDSAADPTLEIARPLLRNFYQKDALLGGQLCPADLRIQGFLDAYFAGAADSVPRLPANTFVLDRPGLARIMSLPQRSDTFRSSQLTSYRVAQGVLHNPKSDRRTTEGVFHVVEGGLPVPSDKFAVPKQTFVALLRHALRPPKDDLLVPFTAEGKESAHLFVSLLLRPLVCPATETSEARSLEVRFFAPATLVSNLDFVEGIFGNGGDPYLPENDAALDVLHWTGHSGCVILAPHLVGLKKKDLGLPHYDSATERQRRDGMCWKTEDEPYNKGGAFKVTCRDERGVIVTIIADNYYGYCKKEVKTQISYAANLFGMAEEEHAGGAIAFPSYVLGSEFEAGRSKFVKQLPFETVTRLLGDSIEVKPEGYAVDRAHQDILYVPSTAHFGVHEGTVSWEGPKGRQKLSLRPATEYVLPSGYRVRLEKQHGGPHWRLIGTRPDGTLCHKPCTVSGGGKSEISKSIGNVVLRGPVFVREYLRDMDQVAEILRRDWTSIYKTPSKERRAERTVLSPDRSLGSVIKLLTPSPDYTEEHNQWLEKLPQTIRQLVCSVKRYYQPEWGDDWRSHFTVDRINGFLGHELKVDNEKLMANYLRVGFDIDGSWRIYKLRPDFYPADKVQVEDDISASVVLPRESLSHLDPSYPHPSVKIIQNCESLLFQRPDDAVHRGLDHQAEIDLSSDGVFLSNFEPLSLKKAQEIVDHVVEFDKFTEPMKRLLLGFVSKPKTEWAVCSANSRIVDGAPSKNPRYLQKRPDIVRSRETYLSTIATRLYRSIPMEKQVWFPVNAVLAGRRGNPPDRKLGVPPLAVYNPIHYQELPELFMDFISSLTGKSPSTTGFGSEGALTKRPFNALLPVTDINNALLAFVLTNQGGFTSAAGSIGPDFKVDHDISMLVPEIWCRMTVAERDPALLISEGLLEKIDDFELGGRKVLASRLGYRITKRFVERYLGRIFETPSYVFPEEMLRPEKQGLEMFAAGINAVVESQRRVAQEYFEDGSIELACPPIAALLHIMAEGTYQGMDVSHPKIRALFDRETVIKSDWYHARLRCKQQRDIKLWERHLASLEKFRKSSSFRHSLNVDELISAAKRELSRASNSSYESELFGTIGADLLGKTC